MVAGASQVTAASQYCDSAKLSEVVAYGDELEL
jgi:hypothetical protein